MKMRETIEANIPPAVLESFFYEAIGLLGAENVSKDASWGALPGLRGETKYGDPFPLSRPHTSSGAVRPKTVDEVRNVVKAANKHKVPLWTISRGKNLGYGGSAPVLNGSVVLDLHRMDRILEINEEYAYAVVEPGVSYMALYDEIQKRGLKLWMSVPALGWGSVVGNYLDRGFGYTPDAAHYKFQCGMEVVLPNGDLLRTGAGAMVGNKAAALYSGGFGPGLDGLFFQSNYGVVTQIGIHMSHAPEAYMRISVSVPHEPDLVPLVGAMTELMRRRVFSNPPQLFDRLTWLTANLADSTLVSDLGQYASLEKHIPDELVNRICEARDIPAWSAAFALYGPHEALPGLLKAVERRLSQIPGAKVTHETFEAPPGQTLRGEEVTPDFLPQHGVPSIEGLKAFVATEDGVWHNCFSPVIPPSGRELYEWYVGARKICAESDLNFVADFHVFERYVIAINLTMFHPSARARLHHLHMALLDYTSKMGYMEYRTHVSYMDITAGMQDFNQGAFGRFTRLLKDAIDPNGILSPGKSGIWNS